MNKKRFLVIVALFLMCAIGSVSAHAYTADYPVTPPPTLRQQASHFLEKAKDIPYLVGGGLASVAASYSDAINTQKASFFSSLRTVFLDFLGFTEEEAAPAPAPFPVPSSSSSSPVPVPFSVITPSPVSRNTYVTNVYPATETTIIREVRTGSTSGLSRSVSQNIDGLEDRIGVLETDLSGITSFSTTTARSLFSSSATGLTYATSTGDFSLTSGYTIPLTASTTAWEAKVSSQWTTLGSDIYFDTGKVAVGTDSNYGDSKLQVAGGGIVVWGAGGVGGSLLDNSGNSHGHDSAVALTIDGYAGSDILRLRDSGGNQLVTVDSSGDVSATSFYSTTFGRSTGGTGWDLSSDGTMVLINAGTGGLNLSSYTLTSDGGSLFTDGSGNITAESISLTSTDGISDTAIDVNGGAITGIYALKNGNGIAALNLDAYEAGDSVSVASIDWGDRVLYASDGTQNLNWATPNTLYFSTIYGGSPSISGVGDLFLNAPGYNVIANDNFIAYVGLDSQGEVYSEYNFTAGGLSYSGYGVVGLANVNGSGGGAGGYFDDGPSGNIVNLANNTYAIQATGNSYFNGDVGIGMAPTSAALGVNLGSTYVRLGDGSNIAGVFENGSDIVNLADGTYAINATGNSYFSGSIEASSFIGDGSGLTNLPNIFDQSLNTSDSPSFASGAITIGTTGGTSAYIGSDGSASFASGAFSIDLQGRLQVYSGSESPSYSFSGDGDTGLYRSAANEMRFQTGGSDRLTITSAGSVGIGTTTPGQKLTVVGNIDIGTTTSSTGGQLTQNGTRLIHNYGTDNLFVGLGAGNFTTTGTNNGGFGTDVLRSVSTSSESYGFGYRALYSLQGGSANVAFGSQALYNLVSGTRNTAIGRAAGYGITSSDNIAIGYNSFTNSSGGFGGNIGIGRETFFNGTNNLLNNTIVGNYAAYAPDGARYNTGVGAGNLYALTTGFYNTVLGNAAGDNITTGSNNIVIGSLIDAPSATASNQLSIGNLIFGTGLDGTGTTISSGNIGIGTTTPTSRLTLGSGQLELPVGSAAAPSLSFSGDLDTGIYRTATANELGFATGGTGKWFINNAGTLYASNLGINTGGGGMIYNGSGLVGSPGYTFSSDTDTGLYRSAADTIGLVTGGTERIRIDSSGNIGVGTTTPSAQLTNTGTVRFGALGSGGGNLITDALGNVTVSSDERLKDTQGDFTRSLEDLMKIQPISYKWKASTGYDTGSTYTGFSAQNIQIAIPEAVSEDSRGFLTLADRPILATLVNAVKELAVKVEKMFGWFGSEGNSFKVQGDICVDDVCLTKDQFKALLRDAGGEESEPEPAPEPEPTPEPEVVPEESGGEEAPTESEPTPEPEPEAPAEEVPAEPEPEPESEGEEAPTL